jgi:pimeloyl-ACP methyl ester carboxylesterase
MHTYSIRKYGPPPYRAAVLHGGPGACGEMAPVAGELASVGGCLEPLLTAPSPEGQVEELRTALEEKGSPPVAIIGFSWGAWLGILFTARYGGFVRKLILVGCGGFGNQDGKRTIETRLKRIGREDASEFMQLIDGLGDPGIQAGPESYARLNRLLLKTDAYDPVAENPEAGEPSDFRPDVFRSVWQEAGRLRESGTLIEAAKTIRCPIIAIHGDYDPHPAGGVNGPLSAAVERFRFVLLKNCGHTPWIERQAREEFYRIVRDELR